jgi:hypothetical protein
MIQLYKFALYFKAVLEYNSDCDSETSNESAYETESTTEANELYIPDDVKFYEKHNFTAYLTPAKKEIISEYDLISLAQMAIHNTTSEMMSDKEYIEDEHNDEFVCIVKGQETSAVEYFKENGMPYRWSHSGDYAFAKWL